MTQPFVFDSDPLGTDRIRLVQQRDALLAALKECRHELWWLMQQVKARPGGSVDRAHEAAKAAIALCDPVEPLRPGESCARD